MQRDAHVGVNVRSVGIGADAPVLERSLRPPRSSVRVRSHYVAVERALGLRKNNVKNRLEKETKKTRNEEMKRKPNGLTDSVKKNSKHIKKKRKQGQERSKMIGKNVIGNYKSKQKTTTMKKTDKPRDFMSACSSEPNGEHAKRNAGTKQK